MKVVHGRRRLNTKDARGALVHVRRKDTNQCVGCIEAGLYEVLRAIVLEEAAASAREGTPAEATL